MVKFLTLWLCADSYNFLRLFPSAVKEKDNFPKLLTVDKEDVHTHTKKHYSAIKKNENNVICSNMARPRDYHSKWGKSERQMSQAITCVWNLKYDTNEFFNKTETDSQRK